MKPISPRPSVPEGPVPAGRVANGVPPVPAPARADNGHVAAMDRGPDWALMAGITEYESWLRHLR